MCSPAGQTLTRDYIHRLRLYYLCYIKNALCFLYLERTKVRHTLAPPIYEAWNRIVGMGPSTKNNFRLDGYNLCTHTRPDGRPGS